MSDVVALAGKVAEAKRLMISLDGGSAEDRASASFLLASCAFEKAMMDLNTAVLTRSTDELMTLARSGSTDEVG